MTTWIDGVSLFVDLGGRSGPSSAIRASCGCCCGRSAITVVALALLSWATVVGLGWLLPETVQPALDRAGRLSRRRRLVGRDRGLMLVLSVVLMVPVRRPQSSASFSTKSRRRWRTRHYPTLPPARSPGLAAQVGDSLRFLALVVGGQPRGAGGLPRRSTAGARSCSGRSTASCSGASTSSWSRCASGRPEARGAGRRALLARSGRGHRHRDPAERADAEPRGADDRCRGLHAPGSSVAG